MSLVGNVYEGGPVRLEFTRTAAETGGQLHEMRATYEAGSPLPPAHRHPGQDERFEVVAGALTFLIDGERHTVAAGEAIDVPRGAVHQVHNPGEVPAVAVWQTRPALRTGEFHHELHAAVDAEDWARLGEVLGGYGDVFELVTVPEREG
ncbi:cupin domain-containing protein [Nitriliruptor alkaliphilus]|uniref:cupin domain-containing protein n=1 Tax=Nitriliruptor alkaliphilus TaxID=427918 RepID=UPI000696BBFC|nr:cupin domain-containing protein [Nitriliruptor alkaliphilus]